MRKRRNYITRESDYKKIKMKLLKFISKLVMRKLRLR